MILESLSQSWSCRRKRLAPYISVHDKRSAIFSYTEKKCCTNSYLLQLRKDLWSHLHGPCCLVYFKHFKTNSNLLCPLKLFVTGLTSLHTRRIVAWTFLCWLVQSCWLNCSSWISWMLLVSLTARTNLLYATLVSNALPRQNTFWGEILTDPLRGCSFTNDQCSSVLI